MLPLFAVSMTSGILLSSCSQDEKTERNEAKKADDKPPKRTTIPKQKKGKTKSSFSLLEQLHKDTVLRRVRLPRYDENFIPESLLTAKTMEVIDGQTIEASDVSMELYNPEGSVKARTKMRQALYREDTSTLEGKQAIYIEGKGFRVSGSGIVYHTLTGRGFVLGPVSTLIQTNERESPNKNLKRPTN